MKHVFEKKLFNSVGMQSEKLILPLRKENRKVFRRFRQNRNWIRKRFSSRSSTRERSFFTIKIGNFKLQIHFQLSNSQNGLKTLPRRRRTKVNALGWISTSSNLTGEISVKHGIAAWTFALPERLHKLQARRELLASISPRAS